MWENDIIGFSAVYLCLIASNIRRNKRKNLLNDHGCLLQYELY